MSAYINIYVQTTACAFSRGFASELFKYWRKYHRSSGRTNKTLSKFKSHRKKKSLIDWRVLLLVICIWMWCHWVQRCGRSWTLTALVGWIDFYLTWFPKLWISLSFEWSRLVTSHRSSFERFFTEALLTASKLFKCFWITKPVKSFACVFFFIGILSKMYHL